MAKANCVQRGTVHWYPAKKMSSETSERTSLYIHGHATRAVAGAAVTCLAIWTQRAVRLMTQTDSKAFVASICALSEKPEVTRGAAKYIASCGGTTTCQCCSLAREMWTADTLRADLYATYLTVLGMGWLMLLGNSVWQYVEQRHYVHTGSIHACVCSGTKPLQILLASHMQPSQASVP